ncbi:ParA family protein [Stenoxybacter acetivorans]|uniref:ParA family protein n=1 Tax=Stenoxybacter acetivorans TaxID=422441 RepID=UPI0005645F05|nr:ParA family protein [Stenoxybacter acetivorans]
MSAPIVFATVATKGGVGKTTLTANVSAILADIGCRVLMIDADVQPSLSKYYPLHYSAPHGVVELLLGDNSEALAASCVSKTVYPNLDIILSNNISADIETKVQNRHDRAFLLKTKLLLPFVQKNYDVILIDTQGAVGVLQDTAAFASEYLITPIMPEVLSAREFVSGTQEALIRLQHGVNMGLSVPKMRALIYAQNRTKDARFVAEEIKTYFHQHYLDGKQQLLDVVVPQAKAYTEAATLRLPVHCHEQQHSGKADSAYKIMHEVVYELLPGLKEQGLQGNCFGGMKDLLPEEDFAAGVA